MTEYTAQTICKAGTWTDPMDCLVLTYEARFLRRKVLRTETGLRVLVDLEHTTSLNDGDALQLADGRKIEVKAAPEPLFAVTGNLVQLAWHIGNRHTPCQMTQERLLIQRDKVIGHMLEHLGATVVEVTEPFTPEGGAYGFGRTHSHEHGATAHSHDH